MPRSKKRRPSRKSHESEFIQMEPFFDGLTPEEKHQQLLEAQVNAEQIFSKTTTKIAEILRASDPAQLLASYGFLFFAIQADSSSTQAPTVNQHHLELLQAMALRIPPEQWGRGGRVARQITEIIDLVNDNAQSFQFRRIAALADGTEKSRRAATLEQVRGDTQFVRGEFHDHQNERYLRAILTRIDDPFKAVHGIKATTLLDILRGVVSQIEDQLATHIKLGRRIMRERKASKAIRAYFTAFPEEEAHREAIMLKAAVQRVSDDVMHQFLWEQTDKFLPRAYSVGLANIARLCPESENLDAAMRAMSAWTLGFGDLADTQPDHVYLANPVWSRPFIAHKGLFFLPTPGTLIVFTFLMFEQMIEADPSLKERYEAARAEFLEDELARLLRQSFPSGQVTTGLHWTGPLDGRAYENDAFVLIDRTALLFEAKSGQVTAPARRGAEGRLKGEVAKLMVEPAKQSQRLEELLAGRRGLHVFQTDQGTVEIDSRRIDTFVRISIVFNTIGATSSRWPELVEAGLIPADLTPVPTMGIADLEVVCELLQAQTDICHYLRRRTDLERNALYLADEYDLTAFYLSTGFNIGETEFDGTFLHLYGMSDKLAPYYSRNREPRTPKPTPTRSALWRRFLQGLEQRQSDGWIEIAYRLLNLEYDQQVLIEQQIGPARRQVLKSRDDAAVSANIAVGPPQRRSAMAFVVFKAAGKAERDRHVMAFGAEAAETAGTQDCLVVAIDAQQGHLPYSAIGLVTKPAA